MTLERNRVVAEQRKLDHLNLIELSLAMFMKSAEGRGNIQAASTSFVLFEEKVREVGEQPSIVGSREEPSEFWGRGA